MSLVICSGLFTSNLLAQRGVTGAVWAIAGTGIALVATAIAVSRLAFADRPPVAETPVADEAMIES